MDKFASGSNWDNWMPDFRFGTLVFFPDAPFADQLRREYDPASAKSCPSHLTLTQPFSAPPDIEALEGILGETQPITLTIGPFTASPNGKLLWMRASPDAPFLAMRDFLHSAGLFRTDLPLTKGFIPHLTISEAPREPEEVIEIAGRLNTTYKPFIKTFGTVSWIVPDEDFVFTERARLPLA